VGEGISIGIGRAFAVVDVKDVLTEAQGPARETPRRHAGLHEPLERSTIGDDLESSSVQVRATLLDSPDHSKALLLRSTVVLLMPVETTRQILNHTLIAIVIVLRQDSTKAKLAGIGVQHERLVEVGRDHD
jgi:hypothetical protein